MKEITIGIVQKAQSARPERWAILVDGKIVTHEDGYGRRQVTTWLSAKSAQKFAATISTQSVIRTDYSRGGGAAE